MNTAAGPRAEALEVSTRRWVRWLWIPVVVALVAAGAWWLGHPAELPSSGAKVSVTTKVGQPVYLAALGPEYDGRRNLEVTKVTTPVDAAMDGAYVEAWICRSGSIAQTTDPSRFCDEVVPAKGNPLHLGGGDQMIISVVADESGTVEVGQLEVSFREGLQRGTQPAGPSYDVDVRD
ncbi:MAG: hypothetical protein L0H93_00735 [Nocardioides sp.]|nr:hypothetical protein [Nocardioides sp.]